MKVCGHVYYLKLKHFYQLLGTHVIATLEFIISLLFADWSFSWLQALTEVGIG